MMKEELLEKFKTLLQAEDITSIKAEVKNLLTNYNGLTSEEKKAQQEAWNKEKATVELAKEAEASDAPAEVEVPAEAERVDAEAEVAQEKKEFK